MVRNPFADELSVRISGDASGATGALDSMIGSLGGLKGAALAAGGALAIGFAAKGVASAVRSAADFNQAMTESVAIMGDVSDTMRTDMEGAAREVAKTTTFSANEAAESYFFLASAGLDAKESIEALPQVAEFAQAGMFDMAQATDILTDAASALGMEMSELNELSDQLVKANTLANASVEQFGTALITKAAPAMRRLNIESEAGIAALSVFADQGLKGRRAGTILARTLEGLSDQAQDNADAFDELGIEVFDADGEMRDLEAIVADMEDALSGMSTEQRQAALEQLGFNRRASQGIDLLIGQSEELSNYREELESAGGTTEEVADKQLQSFNAQVSLLKSEIEDLKIALGTALLPALIGIVSSLNDAISAASDFIQRLKEIRQLADAMPGIFGSQTLSERIAARDGATVEGRGPRQTVRFESDGTPFMDLMVEIANREIDDRGARADRLHGRGAR